MPTLSAHPPSPLLAQALPSDSDLKFAEPWEAKAFAIVVSLAQAGHISWAEWVECFSKEVAAATSDEACGGQPRSYYAQWLNAAETLLAAKGMASLEQLQARRLSLAVAGPMKARNWRIADA
jgi:nitrile hydratase accessory protein